MNIRVNDMDYKIDFIGNKLFVNDKEKIVEIKDDEIILEDKKFYLGFCEDSENESLLIINGMAFKIYRKLLHDQIIKEIESSMNGQITDILVKNGSEIQQGQSLIIVEAMKMYNEIKFPVKAIVKDVVYKNIKMFKLEILL
ncbi:MAG TPA: acetyl-CoA carboxylase biotin carboxyl carrier protein subunit [Verrucomicrobiae bacterium]|nr:acetyl-CoA carboxylase biotin carboxyl carrier protein subunit [Verrucomicrobiae bacterium]